MLLHQSRLVAALLDRPGCPVSSGVGSGQLVAVMAVDVVDIVLQSENVLPCSSPQYSTMLVSQVLTAPSITNGTAVVCAVVISHDS